MNYKKAREYMQTISGIGSRPGLTTITELLCRLGNPQDKLKFVHVAGTNGKGSTCAFIANILACSGYKVGCYFSPVVQESEEYIQISNKGPKWAYIEKEQVAKHISIISQISLDMVGEGYDQPTYYEIETAMAMLEFSQQKCEVVVLETLMGGRLDATNVVKNVITCVITSISMDHMNYLGNTVKEIAREKAGIIKKGVPVITDSFLKEVSDVIAEVAMKQKASVTVVNPSCIIEQPNEGGKNLFTYKGQGPYELQLIGSHQQRNAALAIECVRVLQKIGNKISEESIARGLYQTTLFGRFTILKKNPTLVIDGAHNPDAAKVLKDALQQRFKGKKGVFIMGVFADKNYNEILSILGELPCCLITITAPGERGLSSAELKKAAKKYCDQVIDGENLQKALNLACELVPKDGYVLCFGSLSYLGQVQIFADELTCWRE